MPKSFRWRIAIVICLFVGLLGVRRWLVGYASWLDTALSYACYPVILVQHTLTLPFEYLKNFVHNRTQCDAALNALAQEREELLSRLIECENTAAFYHEIQELRDFSQRYALTGALITQIIFKCRTPREHYFLVDAGSRRGVQADMVALYKNFIVGRVVEVFPYYSKVIVITDQNCKVAAQCIKTGAQGIHEGTGTDQTSLTLVSHLQDVEVGDLVVSSGEGLIFPRGFGLGVIESCTCSGLYHTVFVRPVIDV